jgi:hypothetical protein
MTSFSQDDPELYNNDEPETKTEKRGLTKEIGFDINFSAGTMGGSGGLGLKFGFSPNKYLSFGPSVRYQYSYYKNNGLKGNYSVYGGGAFVHGRFFNYLFAGLEFEMLSSPFVNGFMSPKRKWVPTALLGFGFSHAFGENETFRLNAGIMYDIIDNKNSPFRPGYFMRKENGALIPVVYRIAFFFKL